MGLNLDDDRIELTPSICTIMLYWKVNFPMGSLWPSTKGFFLLGSWAPEQHVHPLRLSVRPERCLQGQVYKPGKGCNKHPGIRIVLSKHKSSCRKRDAALADVCVCVYDKFLWLVSFLHVLW